MMAMKTRLASLTAGLVLLGTPAMAYIGPGAGLGAIGTVIAVIGAVLLMIVGFVWYPLKRLLKRGKKSSEPAAEDQ